MMFGAIACLFVLPWLDTSKVRSMRFRPTARFFFVGFLVTCVVLGFCGAHSPDEMVFTVSKAADGSALGLNYVWLSRVATAYYFLYFLAITPLLGLIEKPLPIPDTISSPVLSHPAHAADGTSAAVQAEQKA
jgi:ubiquinol-cytochrome c reductase cytochrome b subunit